MITKEQRDDLRRKAMAATKGQWRWWTSNSMRRLSSDPSGKDGDVAHAYVAHDGVPDISIRENDMAHIAAAAPPTILALLDALEEAERR